MSQAIISHAKQLCHEHIKYDTAMLLYIVTLLGYLALFTFPSPPRQNLDPKGRN